MLDIAPKSGTDEELGMKADEGSFGTGAGIIVDTPGIGVIEGGGIMGDILDRLPELAEA